jgi:hypothetical protein
LQLLLLHRLMLAAAFVAVVGCQETPPLYPATAPPEIREPCALAQEKCTACHERDRIVFARHNADEWRATIERMRRFPGAAISPSDSEIILRCLLYRTETTMPPMQSLRTNAGNPCTMHAYVPLETDGQRAR